LSLIRPRLTEHHGIFLSQSQVPFAIPFLEEDIPLYVDPFLLWKSKSLQDKALHLSLLNSFNHLGFLATNGKTEEALNALIRGSECDEVGLGESATRIGKRISHNQAEQILGLFRLLPQYEQHGFHHLEEIQFFVDGISKDRISDLACNFLKSFLIDFTMDECMRLGIPLADCVIRDYYDPEQRRFLDNVPQKLPVNPRTGAPLLLVPKRWLRYTPWLSFDNYFKQYCPRDKTSSPGEPEERVKVLIFNRENYGVVEAYVKERERTAEDCATDPLFTQIPLLSAKRKMHEIKKLHTGNENMADKKYEDAITQLMASLLYPHLDFATDQARTDSGAHIRDLIFYNNRSHPFLAELFDDYGSKQLVMEIKNVRAVEREHVEQLNRYMAAELGRFGVFITRNELPKAMFKSTIDVWSGQRKCIVALTDADLEQMVELFESKQRLPLDVLKKKYAQFRMACPV
jgi:hypothetical protein